MINKFLNCVLQYVKKKKKKQQAFSKAVLELMLLLMKHLPLVFYQKKGEKIQMTNHVLLRKHNAVHQRWKILE